MINKCRYVYHCLPVNLSLTLIFTISKTADKWSRKTIYDVCKVPVVNRCTM